MEEPARHSRPDSKTERGIGFSPDELDTLTNWIADRIADLRLQEVLKDEPRD